MLAPFPAFPDVLALRTDFLAIVEPVVDALRDPRRLIGAQSGKLCGEVGSIADPHDVIVTSDARSRGSNLRDVDADHVSDLEVRLPTLLELSLNDILHRIVYLQRTGDGIVALVLGDENPHHAVAIIGYDGASMTSDEARGSVEEGFVDLACKLPFLILYEIGRTVEICIKDRSVREAHSIIAEFQVGCSRHDLSIADCPTYAEGILGVLSYVVSYAHYAPTPKFAVLRRTHAPPDTNAFILCSKYGCLRNELQVSDLKFLNKFAQHYLVDFR